MRQILYGSGLGRRPALCARVVLAHHEDVLSNACVRSQERMELSQARRVGCERVPAPIENRTGVVFPRSLIEEAIGDVATALPHHLTVERIGIVLEGVLHRDAV